MGRPVDTERHAELLWRAVEVLRHRGLHLSMTCLALEVGVKRPTFLYHFPSKARIVETALLRLVSEQVEFVNERVDPSEHPLRQLFAQVRAVHSFHREREDKLLFLSQAILSLNPAQSAKLVSAVSAVFDHQRQIMRARLEEAIFQGRMHTCPLEPLLQLVRASIDGLLIQRFVTDADIAPAQDFLWTHVLAPLLREPETP